MTTGADEAARRAAHAVLERRRADQAERIDLARSLAATLDPGIGVRAVVVFGSVARGDFNVWSDVDVLVVADRLPDGFLARADVIATKPPGVQVVAWTPAEFHRQLERNNPIALEARRCGIWLVGHISELTAPA